MRATGRLFIVLLCLVAASRVVAAQGAGSRALSGVVVTARDEAASGVTVSVDAPAGALSAVSDAEGRFRLAVPLGTVTLRLSGEEPTERIHATPSFPFDVTVELTFRFHGK